MNEKGIFPVYVTITNPYTGRQSKVLRGYAIERRLDKKPVGWLYSTQVALNNARKRQDTKE